MVPGGFRRFGFFCFINQFSKKLHRLASTASDRKDLRYNSKIVFWLFLTQKGTNISHFGSRDDPIIRMRKNFEETGLLRPVRLQRLMRSMRLQRFQKAQKSPLKTWESSSHFVTYFKTGWWNIKIQTSWSP